LYITIKFKSQMDMV